jgi:signal transduction histidine kinase
MSEKRTSSTTAGSGELLFVSMVIISYFLTLSSPPYDYTPLELVLYIAAGVVYALLGTYGSTFCERRGSLGLSYLLITVEIMLGALIFHWSGGEAWLIMLPLVGGAVELLPHRWPTVVVPIGLIPLVLIFSFPNTYFGGNEKMMTLLFSRERWTIMAEFALSYWSAVAFVVIFTRALVNERIARAEVERLATKLGLANDQLRQYAAQAEELAIVKERNRLAREIHDGLGHFLTAINMQIEAGRAVLDSDRPRALDALGKAQGLAQEGLSEVRRSVAALRTSPTQERGLNEAIRRLVEESQAAGIDTQFTVSGDPRPLPPQVELALYRSAQEGLTNVRKHAQASSAEVALRYTEEGSVRLTVRDSGVGAADTGGGYGLMGIRERVHLLGGQVETHSAPEEGFVLEVVVEVEA